MLEEIWKDSILNSTECINPIYVLIMLLEFIRKPILSVKATFAVTVLLEIFVLSVFAIC